MTYKPIDLDKINRELYEANFKRRPGTTIQGHCYLIAREAYTDAREARKVIAALVDALRIFPGSCCVCESCVDARAAIALAAPWVEQKEETKG